MQILLQWSRLERKAQICQLKRILRKRMEDVGKKRGREKKTMKCMFDASYSNNNAV